jgi:RNA polymerase sigma-70 factor (ECF subfamily)
MYIENIDGLYSYALTLTRNHAEAEDLVQETYLRAIQAMGRLRADSNMKGWLFTILRNVWFNQLRKWRNGPRIIEIEVGDGAAGNIAEPSKDSHDLYVSKMEAEQVRAAIQQLSIEFREIIILREYEELSYQEIATVLECPLGTVMSRLARARSKLRDLLSPISLAPRSEKRVTIGAKATGTSGQDKADEPASSVTRMRKLGRRRDLDALRGAVGIFSCLRCFVSGDSLDTPPPLRRREGC